MKIGVYTRVSTDLQVRRGESLDEQVDEARSYCKYKDISIVQVYREEGKSGKNIDRPELKKLLRDCKKGKIDTVIVKKLDRLSRSILDFEKLLRFFEEYKVTLISLRESFDTSSPMSRAAVRIVLVFAQLEREQTSERTRDAMVFRAKRGIWNGGHLPLGYNLIPKKGLIVNKEEAPIVNIIFEKYIELASYVKVANCINDLGYRTKSYTTKKGQEIGGVKFIDTHIARTIQNPVYIGKISYKDELFLGNHEAILSEDIYNHAQEIRNENNRRNGSLKKVNKHNFLLEGLIYCSECNSQMTPRYSRGKSKRYFYYACTKAIHSGKHTCSTRTLSAPAIEQLVLNRIRSIVNDDEVFKEVMSHNDEDNRRLIKELRESDRGIDVKIASIDKKVSMVTNTFGEVVAKDKEHVIANELNRLDKERKDLIKERNDARIKANDIESQTISRDVARNGLKAFTEAYRPLSPYDKKRAMTELIHSVEYGKDRVSIRYYVLDDTDVIINKEGAANHRNGFATPPTWRP